MTNKPTYEELEQRVRNLERAESDRKQAEKAMQEREERLELAVTGTGVGLWDWNLVNDCVHFSPQWKRMLGYEEHEIENAFAGWKRLWHPDDKDKIERAVNDHLAGKTSLYEIEHRLRHKNGSWRWILTRGDIVKDSDGKPVRWVGTHLDITERKQAEEALRESQQFLSRVINENPFPIWIGDSKGTILQCNQALLDLLQLEEHQLVGKYNILEDPLIEHLREDVRNIFDKGETWTFEVQWQAQPSVGVDSALVVIAGVVFPIFNQKGEIVNTVATYHDITEQKNAQNELKASLEKLKNLTKHLQSVREQERTKIARELHDELGQVLTAINLGVYAISNNLPLSHQNLKSRAEATAELSVGAIKSIKRIISELRPILLEDLGLDEAVRYQIREYQSRCSINFVVSIEPEDFFLDDDLSIAVFRVFQEAITNAVRHSNATSISVNLKKTDTGILLKVKDNGIGIRQDQLSQNCSFGIIGMRERAEVFGGTVEISGAGGKGTTLVANFPV